MCWVCVHFVSTHRRPTTSTESLEDVCSSVPTMTFFVIAQQQLSGWQDLDVRAGSMGTQEHILITDP